MFLATGCTSKGGDQPSPAPGPKPGIQIGTYMNSSDVVIFWDPSDSFSNEIIVLNNLYETLLRYDPASDKLLPILAESYTSENDGMTWTFKIRKGVKFHGSNREMTAEDVKKSIERTMTRGMGAAFIWDAVERIEAPDAETVVFHLSYASPIDVISASGYGAFIFDVDYAESKGGEEWFKQGNDAGTGPYTMEAWKKGEDLIITKYADYWKGWDGKHLDKVSYKTVAAPSTRQQMMSAGEADYTNNLPFDMLKSYDGNPTLEVKTQDSFQNLVALINTEKLSPKVREALALTFPYESAVKDVAQGYATASRGIVPSKMWGHAKDLPLRQTDIEKAKSLLADAGAKDLKLSITYSAGDDAQRQIIELWAANLKAVGIETDPRSMTWEAQWDLAKAKDPAQRQDIFLMYWWPDVATPDTWHRNMFHSEPTINFNLSYYNNPAYDALIDEAVQVAATDRAQAASLYAQADKLLFDDAAVIPIYEIQYTRVVKKSLKGFVDNPAYPGVVWWYDTYHE